MSEAPRIRDLILRRGDDLPPGQREVRSFPRFSDQPLRWLPKATPIELTISLEGAPVQTFTAIDLDQFEHHDLVSDFHCVTGWTYRGVRWAGVRLRDVARAAIGDELPEHAAAHAGDSQSAIFVTDDLLGDNVLLATRLDGAPICRKHGAPLRLVSPSQYGYKNVKHLISIDFVRAEPTTTLGPKRHLRGRVALEERHATLPNWAVRLPYRMMIIPTALAGERGLRKSPV